MTDLDFTFTTDFDVDSSFVTAIYYNANTSQAFVEIEEDYVYQYDNVVQEDVAALASATSVGETYNTMFKPTYGPFTQKFSDPDYDIEPIERQGTTTSISKWGIVSETVRNVFGEPTQEYSLSTPPVFDNTVSGAPLTTGDTQEFSLAPKPALSLVPEVDESVTSVVYFTLADSGSDKVFEFKGNETTVDGAINAVNEYVTRIGARGNVVKVEFNFA